MEVVTMAQAGHCVACGQVRPLFSLELPSVLSLG